VIVDIDIHVFSILLTRRPYFDGERSMGFTRRLLCSAEETMVSEVMMRVGLVAIGTCVGLVVGSRTFGAQAAPARKYINIPHLIEAPFSDAVQVGDTVYLAGRMAHDASLNVPSDPADEATVILDGVKSVLTTAGLTMDDLVSVQVFCTDLSLFDAWNRVYRRYFGKDLPARAFIGVGSLLRGARFEMQAIAVRR
jgi:2-iminobutanoate/2-iminopropanoate deaminase